MQVNYPKKILVMRILPKKQFCTRKQGFSTRKGKAKEKILGELLEYTTTTKAGESGTLIDTGNTATKAASREVEHDLFFTFF